MTLKIVQGYCKSFTNRNVIHVSEAEQVERNMEYEIYVPKRGF